MNKYNKCKCQTDEFWRKNVLRKGIKNWIKQKYKYDADVKFIDKHIAIQFNNVEHYRKEQDNYNQIIEEICKQYHMEIDSIFKGCCLKDEITNKICIYELRKKHVKP